MKKNLSMPFFKKFIIFFMIPFCVCLFLGIAAFIIYFYNISSFSETDLKLNKCSVFYSSSGNILRIEPDSSGMRHLYQPIEQIPENIQNAFIAAEDGRFYRHYGFDPFSVIRAFINNSKKKRIVSGASTITQQLVRMAIPKSRTSRNKCIEIFSSIHLENKLSKKKILEYYLNRVPFCNSISGISLAARIYFNKPLESLTIAECAYLASIPKAPGKLNPYGKNKKLLTQRKNYVLKQMFEKKYISSKEYKLSLTQSIEPVKKFFPFEAPHFIERLKKIYHKDLFSNLKSDTCLLENNIYATLNLERQRRVEEILKSNKIRLKSGGAEQACALIIENNTLEVSALVGSLSYSAEAYGFNDGCAALRSPGSTLKPFGYATAIEKGLTAATVIADINKVFISANGDFNPLNYDRKNYGPVMLRAALANSLNQSAIEVAGYIGISKLYETLSILKLMPDKKKVENYGLGLIIGNNRVSLLNLCAAYAVLANKGEYRPVEFLKKRPARQIRKIFFPQTAYIIADILSDPLARSMVFKNINGRQLNYALKTGTSSGYRDCWCIGLTPDYTVGVWCGNFDGMPTKKLSGITASAPILQEIMEYLYPGAQISEFKKPDKIIEFTVCSYSGKKPSKLCRHTKKEIFISGTEPSEYCLYHSQSNIYAALPAQYTEWASEKKTSVYRISDYLEDSPVFDLNKNRVIDNKISITYPFDNDVFKICDFTENSEITLRASVKYFTPYVVWYVNGVEFGRAKPPYRITWPLKKGRYLITAVCANNEIEKAPAAGITVNVE